MRCSACGCACSKRIMTACGGCVAHRQASLAPPWSYIYISIICHVAAGCSCILPWLASLLDTKHTGASQWTSPCHVAWLLGQLHVCLVSSILLRCACLQSRYMAASWHTQCNARSSHRLVCARVSTGLMPVTGNAVTGNQAWHSVLMIAHKRVHTLHASLGGKPPAVALSAVTAWSVQHLHPASLVAGMHSCQHASGMRCRTAATCTPLVGMPPQSVLVPFAGYLATRILMLKV